MKRTVTVLAAVLALTLPALAARQAPDYTVEIGYAGFVRTAQLVPITVTLDNRVGSTRGVIEVVQGEVAGGGYEVRHTLPFESPSPSRKRFQMLVRLEDLRRLELRIDFEDHLLPVRRVLKTTQSPEPVVLCVGAPRHYRQSSVAKEYRFVALPAMSLPEDPLTLDAAYAVLLTGPVLATLPDARVRALKDWVHTGGILLVSDPDTSRDFLVNFQRVTGRSGATFEKVAVFRAGAGTVGVSAQDDRSTQAFWDTSSRARLRLFPPRKEKVDQYFYGGVGGLFTNLWPTKRSYGALGVFWVIAIIVGYIIMIGPIDRLIVRRLKKPYLTWILFPGMIAVFSVLAYSYSNFVTVGTMRSVALNIVDTGPGAGVARGTTLFWLYSAKNATYRIGTAGEDVALSARESGPGSSAGTVAGVTVQNGKHSLITARIPVFSSKTFDAGWVMPWPHVITCTRDRERRLQVTVPAGLKVRAAFLAQRDGLSPARKMSHSKDGTTLVFEMPKVQAWDAVIEKHAQSLRYAGMYYHSYQDQDMMPPMDTLQDYLICMSFPWQREKDDGSYSYDAATQSLYRRDRRERGLDVRGRLENGPIVLLFLDGKRSVFPMKVAQHAPQSAAMDLVRVHVPENM